MQIIPAIDIIAGNCVRLTQGDYAQETRYSEDPLDVAKAFEQAGLQRVHVVDLEGAKAGKIMNASVLETIAAHTTLQVDFGGGIHTEEAVQQVIDAGATWVTIGSVAVKAKEKLNGWLDTFGVERFMLGADVKGTQLAISGWTETTDQEILPFIEYWASRGIRQVFCTDISKDGKLMGPSIDLYSTMIESLPGLHLVASGGVSSMEDLHALKSIGCKGAIVGKAIYEGKINLKLLSSFNDQ